METFLPIADFSTGSPSDAGSGDSTFAANAGAFTASFWGHLLRFLRLNALTRKGRKRYIMVNVMRSRLLLYAANICETKTRISTAKWAYKRYQSIPKSPMPIILLKCLWIQFHNNIKPKLPDHCVARLCGYIFLLAQNKNGGPKQYWGENCSICRLPERGNSWTLEFCVEIV